jgi:RNA polymerase sigma factor (sigma-70 family)
MSTLDHTSLRIEGHSWPERLRAIAGTWREPLEERARERTREEIWVLVVGALDLKIRRQLNRRSAGDPELAYDLAVKKALDLLDRFARGDWDPGRSTPGQLQSFFAVMARNSVIDYERSRAGKTRAREVGSDSATLALAHVGPEESVGEQRRVASAVIDCAGKLTDRSRRIWFLRLFYEMSSRRIGAHPEVGMSPEAVDMALHRCRAKMQECLLKQGVDGSDFGPGVYAACWEAFMARNASASWRLGAEGEDR